MTMRSYTKIIKDYYHLTKPGIIRGNALTATAGFLFAADGNIDVRRYLALLVGISLVIASACVINNYIDRDIDRKMERTKDRAFATGRINTTGAISYAAVLGLFGFWLLLIFTNFLTLALGTVGYVFYIALYGITKRTTIHGTLVGSISGAMPPVAGYCAVTNSFNTGAWLILLAMIFWQMAHFYSIAIYRLKDYRQASLPVLPAIRGVVNTKKQILAYILLFILTCVLFKVVDIASYTFAIAMSVVGVSWFYKGIKNTPKVSDEKWARGMFLYSLKVILVFSLLLTLDTYLP